MTSGATKAKVKARGLDGTGVTEDVARKLFSMVGSGNALVAIVEIEPVTQINDATGDHQVVCTLGFVEVAEVGSRSEDVLREFARGLYRDRRVSAGELEGTGASGERQTDDIATEADSLIDKGQDPGGTDGDGEGGIWKGDTDESAVAPGPGAADPAFEPHTFLPGTTDSKACAMPECGKSKRANVHQLVAAG